MMQSEAFIFRYSIVDIYDMANKNIFFSQITSGCINLNIYSAAHIQLEPL